jgi:hypothetical protein
METVIEFARGASPTCEALGLAYKPDNLVAEQLYRSLGFKAAGVDGKGEMVAWLRLDQRKAERS